MDIAARARNGPRDSERESLACDECVRSKNQIPPCMLVEIKAKNVSDAVGMKKVTVKQKTTEDMCGENDKAII